MKIISTKTGRKIGYGEPVFIIAEAGINHNGDIVLAKEMIKYAAEIGVDAVKFQTFKAEEFISNKEELFSYYSQGKKITESMYEMFKRYEFSTEEWREINTYCREMDVEFLSTAQNPSDLDFLLDQIGMSMIKVGSDDLTNLDLMKYYGSKGLPMIISAGMAYLAEIDDAVSTIRETGNQNIIVLHCVANYPAGLEEANLRKIKTIQQTFSVISGFSDHTQGTLASMLSVACGAFVVEKHFTLDKMLQGPDHWFSADKKELKELVEGIRLAENCLGSSLIGPTKNEMEMRNIARRSLVAKYDLTPGEILTQDNITMKRPGTGLSPKMKETVLGQSIKHTLKKDELILLKDIEWTV